MTENGFACKGENDLTPEEAVNDVDRLNYFKGNLEALMDAIDDGVPIKSYFPWSFLDNFEWSVLSWVVHHNARSLFHSGPMGTARGSA